MGRRARAAAPRRIPIDRIVVVVGALTLTGTFAGTGLLAAWLTRAPAPVGLRSAVDPAGRRVGLPAAWFAGPVSGDAAAERLDLVIPWSDLAAPGGSDRLHVTVTRAPATEAPLSPARRYARFLTAQVEPLADGLVRRRFKAGSPFEGEDLYLAQADGSRFAARCAVEVAVSAPDTACLSEVQAGDLSFRLRFAADRLPAWNGALQALERAFGIAPTTNG
ncbi:hypothetical protein [Methylobacterium sp. ID0610]|uniref:hypothetical protein n=1 Tax=Methylobacterium carpenticola TaxID=3344827 RepID=UPI003678B23C